MKELGTFRKKIQPRRGGGGGSPSKDEGREKKTGREGTGVEMQGGGRRTGWRRVQVEHGPDRGSMVWMERGNQTSRPANGAQRARNVPEIRLRS